jgi:hypothetical protein
VGALATPPRGALIAYARGVLISYTFQLSINCNACKQPMPVNGLADSIPCYHCGEVERLGTGFWKMTIDRDVLATARTMKEGAGKTSHIFQQGKQYELAYGHRSPRCQSCKGPNLELDAIAGMAEAGHCFCPQCGHEIRVRAPDKMIEHAIPGVKAIVGETLMDAEAKKQNAKAKPIMFPCMGCGAGLPIDGSHRQVACQYCSQANYLPDGLWQLVNPVPKVRTFFVICDTDSKEHGHENPLEAEAHNKQTLPARLLELAHEKEADVRIAVAHNRHATPAALWDLSQDTDIEVVRAVASNKSTPERIQVELAKSEDLGVLKALLHNQELSRAVVDACKQHSDETVRGLAAKHRNGIGL